MTSDGKGSKACNCDEGRADHDRCSYCTGEDCYPCWIAGRLATCEHDGLQRHGDRPCPYPDGPNHLLLHRPIRNPAIVEAAEAARREHRGFGDYVSFRDSRTEAKGARAGADR
jgi:hypothetical protein